MRSTRLLRGHLQQDRVLGVGYLSEERKVLTFGRHKGKPIDQIDDAYLQWMLARYPVSSWWGKAAAEVLESRGLSTKTSVGVLLADLKSCSLSRNLEWGKTIHAKVLASGNESNTHVATALVNMYAKCGSMLNALQVFDSIGQPDVVAWNALLLGYAANGEGLIALDLFSRLKRQGFIPDSVTYVAALKACASLGLKQDARCLEWGKQIHLEIGCRLNRYVQNTLIDMYAKCGSMSGAHQVFETIKHPDVVSWNALLLGYAEEGKGLVVLDLFCRMKSKGCAPDSITYVAALKACASLAQQEGSVREEWLERGKQIHSEIPCYSSVFVQSTLIDMYAKCGSTLDARLVFDNITRPDVVSWTTMLLGYADNGEGHVALELFSRMKSQGCAPDSITYVAAIKACASLALKQDSSGRAQCLDRGKQIHSEIGYHLSLCVQNILIDMYAKCGSMADAHQVFVGITNPDVISWSALLLGYADSGDGFLVLDLFSKMKSQGCAPNSITYVAVLKACGLLGTLDFGRKIHAEISEFNTILVTCLVDFYAKCGSLVEAREVFDSHSKTRDLATWNALLAGYCSFGETDSVFELFGRMQDTGFQPDGVTFQSLLMCCSHAGLVEKARDCFKAMSTKYGVTACVEHYTCMVDALGRANKLDDALVLLQTMPCSPDALTWTTILGACCKWKNADIGRLAFHSLVSLDERHGAAYVLMAHIYASRGMWQEQEMVLEMRRNISVTAI